MDNSDILDLNVLNQSNSIRNGKDRVFIDIEVCVNNLICELRLANYIKEEK